VTNPYRVAAKEADMFRTHRAAAYRWFSTIAVVAGAALSQSSRQDVLVGAKLTAGFNMGVDSSKQERQWLVTEGDHLKMSYPSGQSWGAVFITVGKPTDPPRPFRDLSAYNTLTVEMKGGLGGEQLEIGIKTNTQPDDGSETKAPVRLTPAWKSYQFRLDRFGGADPHKLYVVTEFVFSGPQAETVFARNISYSTAAR
jgi:hypothetical protein